MHSAFIYWKHSFVAAAQKSPCMRRKQQLHRLFGEVHLCALVYRAPVCVCVRLCACANLCEKSLHQPFTIFACAFVVCDGIRSNNAGSARKKHYSYIHENYADTKKKRERERLNNWRQVAPIMKYSSFMFRWGNVYFGMQFLGCAHNPNGTPGERERERERASDQKM